MKNKIDTVLITGGCGFVGSNLVEYLLENTNWNIRILDNLSEGNFDYTKKITSQFDNVELKAPTQLLDNSTTQLTSTQPLNDSTTSQPDQQEPRTVTVIEGDIRNADAVKKAVEGVTAVVHLAAVTGVPISIEKPKETFQVNVNGTQNLLEACRTYEVEKFVLASSNAAVGDQEPPMHEEMVPKPISPYGASKLAGEGLCKSYSGSFNLQANALRFANVYGPYSEHKSSVIPKFIHRAKRGEKLEIYGDGNQTRDFIHASDIAQGINLTLESENSGEVFQIGTGNAVTINELVDNIQNLAEKKKKTKTKLDVTHSQPRKGDIYKNFSDSSKAKEELSFEPDYTLKQGLENLWNTSNL